MAPLSFLALCSPPEKRALLNMDGDPLLPMGTTVWSNLASKRRDREGKRLNFQGDGGKTVK